MRRPTCLALRKRTPTWGCRSWSNSWKRSGWRRRRTPSTNVLPPTTQSEVTLLCSIILFENCLPLHFGDFHRKQFCFRTKCCWWEPHHLRQPQKWSLQCSAGPLTITRRNSVPSSKVATGYNVHVCGFWWGTSASNKLNYFFSITAGKVKRRMFGSNLLKFTTQSSSLLSAVVAFKCQMSWLQLYIMHTAVWVLMCFWEVMCFLDIKSPLNIHDSQKVRDFFFLLSEIWKM